MLRLLVILIGAGYLILCVGEPNETWRNWKDGAAYVRIPAGELSVGAARYRFPEGFWMSRTEVTVNQFGKFVADTGYLTRAEQAESKWTWRNPGFAQTGDHPVVWLNFQDAVAYARWAGVDLPTEAEWVYAARANTTTKFYWGDRHDDRYMWHRENSPDGTHAVAQKLPNAWGLFDMIGNAWEFTIVQTPEGEICADINGQLGASWTRCPRYKMRDGRIIDGIEISVGPVRTKCPPRSALADDSPWDDDRGIRCVRHIRKQN